MVEAQKSRKNDQINSKSTSDRQSNCKSTSERQSNLLFVCSILTSTNYRVVSWFSRGLVVLAWSRESSRLAALRCHNASGGNWRRAEDAAIPRRSRNATLTSPVYFSSFYLPKCNLPSKKHLTTALELTVHSHQNECRWLPGLSSHCQGTRRSSSPADIRFGCGQYIKFVVELFGRRNATLTSLVYFSSFYLPKCNLPSKKHLTTALELTVHSHQNECRWLPGLSSHCQGTRRSSSPADIRFGCGQYIKFVVELFGRSAVNCDKQDQINKLPCFPAKCTSLYFQNVF